MKSLKELIAELERHYYDYDGSKMNRDASLIYEMKVRDIEEIVEWLWMLYDLREGE